MNNRIYELPIEIWPNHIPLDFQMLARLQQTSHHFGFFSSSFPHLSKAYKLVQCVMAADCAEAKRLITDSPDSVRPMFQQINFLNADGTIEKYSPLQRAYRFLYTEMCQLFYSKIEHDPSWKKQFFEQISKVQFSTSENSLQEALAEYESLYYKKYLNVRAQLNYPEPVIDAWFKLGAEQKKMPLWLMQRVYAKNPIDPANPIYSEEGTNPIKLSSYEMQLKPGEKPYMIVYGRFRGDRPADRSFYSYSPVTPTTVAYDLQQIQNLLAEAKTDMRELIKNADQSNQPTSP